MNSLAPFRPGSRIFLNWIPLKMAEGTAQLVRSYLKSAFNSSLAAQAGAVLAGGALNAVREKLDPRKAARGEL